MKKNYPVEMIIYGRMELMVMKYCPLKKCLNYCSQCNNSQDQFSLEDKFGNQYPLVRENCLTHILHCRNIDKIDNVEEYFNMGVRYYRLELFNENKKEVQELILRFKKNHDSKN